MHVSLIVSLMDEAHKKYGRERRQATRSRIDGAQAERGYYQRPVRRSRKYGDPIGSPDTWLVSYLVTCRRYIAYSGGSCGCNLSPVWPFALGGRRDSCSVVPCCCSSSVAMAVTSNPACPDSATISDPPEDMEGEKEGGEKEQPGDALSVVPPLLLLCIVVIVIAVNAFGNARMHIVVLVK